MKIYPIELQNNYYDLTGPQGNAFTIVANTSSIIRQVLKFLGAESHEIDAEIKIYQAEAMSSDYEHLLEVTKEYVLYNYIRD